MQFKVDSIYKLVFILGLFGGLVPPVQAQQVACVSLEIKRIPNFVDAPRTREGIELEFFVADTHRITGLSLKSKMLQWTTDSGEDLLESGRKISKSMKESFSRLKNLEKDDFSNTALYEPNSFEFLPGQGFVFGLRNWSLPQKGSKQFEIIMELQYTQLSSQPEKIEEVTELAGNFHMLTSIEFKGNRIAFYKQNSGDSSTRHFSAKVTNEKGSYGIGKMQYLDANKKILGEVYFDYANTREAYLQNPIESKAIHSLKLYFRKLELKQLRIEKTIDLSLL